MELALACHYRLAATRAVFGLPEVQFGLMPGCGGTIRLPRLIKPGRATDLILSGRNLLADEAKAIGLVDAVFDRKDLLPAAETFIRGVTGPVAW
jgi:enoyl-CoA hydratase/carnithine racemase